MISAVTALGRGPTTSTQERLTTSLPWLRVYHQHQPHHLRAPGSRDTYPSSAQMSPPTADSAPNPPSALEGCWLARDYLLVLPPTLPTKPGFPCQAGVCASTLMQTMGAGEGWARRWILGWLWHHSVLISVVDVMCIHSANITRRGCASCCHDSSNTWPWARLLPLPSLCLPAYLSCLIR